MPEGALTRCSRAGERGAGVSRTRAFVFARDGGGRRFAAGRGGSRRRDGRSPETGAVRSPSLAGSARIGEALPRCGSVASAKERGRRCGLRAAPGGEALRLARGEPSDPAGGDAAALAARPVPGAEKPCCRRESALPARKMLVPAAFPCRGFSSEGGAPCGKTRRETGCAGRKASARKGVSETPGSVPPERQWSLHARCSTFRAQALPASIRSRPFLR